MFAVKIIDIDSPSLLLLLLLSCQSDYKGLMFVCCDDNQFHLLPPPPTFSYSLLLSCKACVDALFTRPSAARPECGLALRRNLFRLQQFEDSYVEKEVEIRKKILKEWVMASKYCVIYTIINHLKCDIYSYCGNWYKLNYWKSICNDSIKG